MKTITNFSRALENTELNEKELKHLLNIALGINSVIRNDLNLTEIESENRIKHVKLAIYKTFGSPGDWGYGTELGKALMDIIGK